jgi:hypothetical protein
MSYPKKTIDHSVLKFDRVEILVQIGQIGTGAIAVVRAA